MTAEEGAGAVFRSKNGPRCVGLCLREGRSRNSRLGNGLRVLSTGNLQFPRNC